MTDAARFPGERNALEQFYAELPETRLRHSLLQFLSDLLLIPRIWRDRVRWARATAEEERKLDRYIAKRASDPNFEAEMLACCPERLSLARHLKVRANLREEQLKSIRARGCQ